MEPDRLEKLVVQVLEETRAFRQETKERIEELRQEMSERFTRVDERFVRVDETIVSIRRDVGLVQAAVIETAQNVKRVEAKLDEAIANHGARLDRLEGAAE